MTIPVPKLGRSITGRETGSNKQTASKSCALSIVRQMYHLGVIEPFSGTLKKKTTEQIPPYEVSVDPELFERITKVLDQLQIKPPMIDGNINKMFVNEMKRNETDDLSSNQLFHPQNLTTVSTTDRYVICKENNEKIKDKAPEIMNLQQTFTSETRRDLLMQCPEKKDAVKRECKIDLHAIGYLIALNLADLVPAQFTLALDLISSVIHFGKLGQLSSKTVLTEISKIVNNELNTSRL